MLLAAECLAIKLCGLVHVHSVSIQKVSAGCGNANGSAGTNLFSLGFGHQRWCQTLCLVLS